MKPSALDFEPRPKSALGADFSPGTPLLRLGIALGLLTFGFALPLYHLTVFALGSSLYSHIPLIPLVSGYLIWMRRSDLVPRPATRARGEVGVDLLETSTRAQDFGDKQPGTRNQEPGTSDNHAIPLLLLGLGLLALGSYLFAVFCGPQLATVDSLAWTTVSYLLLAFGAGAWFLPPSTLRSLLFPLCFLLFMIPFPSAVEAAIEAFLQHGSAEAAHLIFAIAGTPLLREGLMFQLPGFSLQVAPQCSGIRSSLVLFITSLVAADLFFHARWRKVVLVLFVIPLGLLRNGFRVFVIGTLCVEIGPEMVHHWIHRQGGPIFFALSLIPFFLLAALLWWTESDRRPSSLKLRRDRVDGDRLAACE